jgi:hypothetical protein
LVPYQIYKTSTNVVITAGFNPVIPFAPFSFRYNSCTSCIFCITPVLPVLLLYFLYYSCTTVFPVLFLYCSCTIPVLLLYYSYVSCTIPVLLLYYSCIFVPFLYFMYHSCISSKVLCQTAVIASCSNYVVHAPRSHRTNPCPFSTSQIPPPDRRHHALC